MMTQRRTLWTCAVAACTWLAGGASADLIGLEPFCPEFTHDQPGELAYDASTGGLTVVADLKTIQFKDGGPVRLVEPTGDPPARNLLIRLTVDDDGDLVAGVQGPDLIIVGQIDLDGDGTPEFSGVLLTGEIERFGHRDGPVGAREESPDKSVLPYSVGVDYFDFLFTPTGGALAQTYGDQGVGATVRSRGSTFHGRFTEDFEGQAAGAVGALGDTGACCFPDGSCEEGLTREECQAAGGSYQGDGVPCQPGTCRPPKGACCLPDGSCDRRPRERCEAVGGVYQGDETNCEDDRCDPGACCLTDDTCKEMTEGECDDRGGEFQGRLTNCDDVQCAPVGACCFDNGDCVGGLSLDECEAQGGEYQGDGSLCAETNCGRGACCLEGGVCKGDLTQDECRDAGGLYQGDGTTCADVECPPTKGACCFPNGACGIMTQDECRDAGGLYQGDESLCEPGRCPPPKGACCFDDGSCSVMTQDDCRDAGGLYQGNDTICEPGRCPPPKGACCFPNGDCSVATQEDCLAQGGLYQGNDTICEPDLCPDPEGACCLPNGDCVVTTQDECQGQGGVYQGDDVDCEPDLCRDPEGACCFDDGDCLDGLTEAECGAAGGDYQGDGSMCADVECGRGACCFDNGDCLDGLTETECAAQGGAYQGDGTECANVDCGGACCLPDEECDTGGFECDDKIVQMTMIWDGAQAVRIKAYDGNVGSDLLLDMDGVNPGDEVTVGPLAGPNDSFWEVFEAGTDNLIGLSKFHRSCSDDEMDGPEDCGTRQGNGKGNDDGLINDWLLEGLVTDKGFVLDCTGDSGNCIFVSAEECAAQGGVFQGGGTSCDDVECVDPTGACCLDNDCQDLSRFCCEQIGGFYQGDGTNCMDDPCFDCDGKIVEMTMIWDGAQPVRIKAYDGPVGDDLLLDMDDIQPGDEVTVGPLAGPNDSFWEVFEAGTDNLIGRSKFHRSCSDDEMNGAEDCGRRQGNGKGNENGLINDWILEGLVDEGGAVLDCSMGLARNVTRRVATDLDDVEERASDGACYVDSSDLELAHDTTWPTSLVGIRFLDVDVPAGALIERAYIQFTADENNDGAVALIIRGQADDAPAPFADVSYDLSSRPATSASVAWSPLKWDSAGEAGPDQRTPDLTPIVQEIVDRGGWTAGNPMVFIIDGEGTRTAESYRGDPAAAPLLRIAYSLGASRRPPTERVTGDLNGDGLVDTHDLLQLMERWGACEACPEDLNGDRVVDRRDLVILTRQF